MTLSKGQLTLQHIDFSFDAGGVMTDVQAVLSAVVSEDGVPSRLSFQATVSLLAQLTPQQVTQLTAIAGRLRQLALASDPPLPVAPP